MHPVPVANSRIVECGGRGVLQTISSYSPVRSYPHERRSRSPSEGGIDERIDAMRYSFGNNRILEKRGSSFSPPMAHRVTPTERCKTLHYFDFEHRKGKSHCTIPPLSVFIRVPSVVEQLRDTCSQQILGNCSPESISTTREPPIVLFITTVPGCCATTSPTITASRP